MRTGYNGISGDIEALITEEGRITHIVSEKEYESLITDFDESFSLHGMHIRAGLKNHAISLLALSDDLLGLSLSNSDSLEKVKEQVQSVKKNAKQWIVLRGLQTKLETELTLSFLDEIGDEYALVLIGEDNWYLNAKALQLSDMDSVEYMEDGEVNKDTGCVSGAAIDLVKKKITRLEVEEIKERIMKAVSFCNTLGFTEVYTDDFGYLYADFEDILTAYQQLAFQDSLNMRVHIQCRFQSEKELAKFLDEGQTTYAQTGLCEIGSVILKLDNENVETMYQLANEFNMSKLVEVHDEDEYEAAIALLQDNMYQDNLLKDGILSYVALTTEQKSQLQELGIVYVEVVQDKGQLNEVGYYGMSFDRNSGAILNQLLKNDIQAEMVKPVWEEPTRTGKIATDYCADFIVYEEVNSFYKIHMCVVNGKVVMDQ